MTEVSTTKPRVWVIVAAAGSGKRFGGSTPKQFASIAGETLLDRTITSLQACKEVEGLVLVLPPDRLGSFQASCETGSHKPILLTAGGPKRMDSVRAGVEKLPQECNLVLVHDGVRPNVTPELVSRVVASAWQDGASVPAFAPADTVKRVNQSGRVVKTLDRRMLRLVQTPQGFRREVLENAYRWAEQTDALEDFTDDAALVEASGGKVTTVAGDPDNIKVTVPEDLNRFHLGIPRVGYGYDVHRLVPGRKLVLCGVKIEHNLGLLGHSDADVALHALCDAILGAAGCGDIGRHFPDTDPQYHGVSSLELLKQVVKLAAKTGFRVSSADITIVAQAPHLSMLMPQMIKTVADTLKLPSDNINIKATTEEGLGFTGTGQGIASHAVAVLVPRAGS